jgi:hypothetical protein
MGELPVIKRSQVSLSNPRKGNTTSPKAATLGGVVMVNENQALNNTENTINHQNAFGKITANDDALAILRVLAQEDEAIAKMLENPLTESTRDINVDEIAEQVYGDLEFLKVEEVWERSGATRYGYIDPNEAASEMLEEALKPFLEVLKKYQALSLPHEAKYYCMGILKGIYRFAKESKSQFKDWAGDAPRGNFSMILGNWQKDWDNPDNLREMEEFIKKSCLDWVG